MSTNNNSELTYQIKPLSYKDLLDNITTPPMPTIETFDNTTVNPPSKSGPIKESNIDLPLIKTELINPLIPEKIAQITNQMDDFKSTSVDKETKKDFKFNFASNWVKLILGLIGSVIVGLMVFGYFNVLIPNIEQDSLKLSNQSALIVSKTSPFFVNINGKNILSYESQGVNIIDLGKLEGNNNFNIGGVLNWGPININAGNTKTYSIKRDFIGISLKTPINKYFEDSNPILDLEFTKDETGYQVFINNINSTENEKCLPDSSSKVKCKFEFAGLSKRPLVITLKDNAGNTSEVFNDTIELVPQSKFDCNKAKIEVDGKIECISNFDGKVKYNNQELTVTRNNILYIDQILDDGLQKLNFTITTNQGIVKTYTQEYQVNKQLLSVMFNSSIDEKYSSNSRPLIILNANATTDATLDFNESYVENANSGLRKPFKLLNITNIKQGEKTVILADQFDDTIKNNLNLKLKFRNSIGRAANYSCARESSQKEFKCIAY
jgi:hypothetical protein